MNYNDLLEDMPKNLNQIEQARWLYIKLGKYYSYDQNYYTSETMEEKLKIAKKNPEEITDDNVVCTSMNKIYHQLLEKLGINSNIINKPTEENKSGRLGHSFTELEINGKKYFTDIIEDLTKIKLGFKTNNFIIKDTNDKYDSISEAELKKIDDKIGYTYKRNVYE